MMTARDTRTARSQARSAVPQWRAQARQQHAQRAPEPEPERDTSRILAQLAVLAWLLFLLGCCALAWFWTSDTVQSFLAAVRGLS